MICPDCQEILEPLTTQLCDECWRRFCTECCKPREIRGVIVPVSRGVNRIGTSTVLTCAACEPEAPGDEL